MIKPAGLALSVNELFVSFGGLRAVDGLSFEARAGEVTALVGPNGAGKSTALNIISGHQRPETGRIHLSGPDREPVDLLEYGPTERARLGLGRTFQHPRLFPQLSIWENVAASVLWRRGGRRWLELVVPRLASRGAEERYQRALGHLELFDLHDRAWSSPLNLSLGQQRLVEIARCLNAGASVLLLDEPYAGLSETATATLTDVLLELSGVRRIAIVLIEHNLGAVRRTASSVVVMVQGSVLVEGDPDTALRDRRVVDAFLGPEELLA